MKKKPEEMSDVEILIQTARESLEKYGTALPPGSSTVARKPKKESAKVDYTKVKKFCPKCEETKKIDPDFGFRTARGVERIQSWCKHCRATTNYYDKARKYKKD